MVFRVKEKIKILNTITKGRLTVLITSCVMNRLLKEREDRERWGRRCKQLMDKSKATRRYWELKETAVESPIWRIRFGRGWRPVERQATWQWRALGRAKLYGLVCVTCSTKGQVIRFSMWRALGKAKSYGLVFVTCYGKGQVIRFSICDVPYEGPSHTFLYLWRALGTAKSCGLVFVTCSTKGQVIRFSMWRTLGKAKSYGLVFVTCSWKGQVKRFSICDVLYEGPSNTFYYVTCSGKGQVIRFSICDVLCKGKIIRFGTCEHCERTSQAPVG